VSAKQHAQRPQKAWTGGMRRAWDDLTGELAKWEAVLEREGLGVLSVGPDGGTGRKDVVSLTPAIEARVTGSVWDLSAAVDVLLEALTAYRFDNLVDGQICEMLSRRVPWHRIAHTLRCSKRRVARVSRLVTVWREQRDEQRRTRERLDALLGG
jgi:hypothetical protein